MILKTRGLKFTILLPAGILLIISGAIALIVWYLAPIFFPEIQTQKTVPTLETIKLIDANFNEKVDFGKINIKVWTDPNEIKPNEEVELLLEILDSSGKPTSLDNSIHYTKIHTYAVRADLGGSISHLHPTETKDDSGVWRTVVTFPSPGTWHLVSQTARGNTVYQITTTFEIEGQQSEAFTPDFSRNKEVSDWNVTLNVSEDPILAGKLVQFTFDLAPKLGTNPPKLKGGILDNGHNFILSRLGDSFLWNQHGDSSVEKVSEQAGLRVKRVPIENRPFAHTVIFPEPGVWLLHFEIESNPVNFFVNVEQ